MANPFRPGTIVEPEYFVGRVEETARFDAYLKNAMGGNPHHLAILGERGIGKTSMLRYLEYRAKRKSCLVVRIDLDPSLASVDVLAAQILAEIKRSGLAYSLAGRSAEGLKDFFRDYNVSVSLGIATVEPRKESGMEPKMEFRHRLQEIWERIRGKVPAVIIMLDEAEHLEPVTGSLHYLRNVFLRLSESRCGYMLVLSGKIGLFRQIKELHSPLARFFTPITLGPLEPEEAKDAIRKPLMDNGIRVDAKVFEEILKDSEGHPYVIQVIGYVLYESGKKSITPDDYDALRHAFMKHLADQMFADMLDASSAEERRILITLAKKRGAVSLKEIAKAAGKKPSHVGSLLTRLVERNCIKRVGRGKYTLFHTLFGEYVLGEAKN